MKRQINLTAKHHEDDSIEIDKCGVKIFQEMESGIKQGFYLTHEALHEIMVEVMQWGQDNGLVPKEEE
jgi:hypothetical protein